MDYNLRRKAILLCSLACITIVLMVVFANISKLKKESNKTAVSASEAETVVLVENTGSNSQVSFEKVGNDTGKWKKDETFFDNEKDTLAQKIMEEMSTLSLKVFSVEKDIRARVIDYSGNLKAGERFQVVAHNNKTQDEITAYDENKDGVIYIDGVKPGDYTVYLKPYEGYIVPDDGEKLEVRDTVEYTMIEDISLLMNAESDVDVEKEDLIAWSAAENADKKTETGRLSDEGLVYGIDISGKNGEINWSEVYGSGIRFVMLRAGYRGADSGKLIVDATFKDNARNAIYAGLDVGAYFYSQAINEREAVEEASALLMLASDINISYPLTIMLDMAGGIGRADELSAEGRTKVADAFCETIRNSGREACIYATANWLETNIDISKLGRNRLWLAEYRIPPSFDGYYDIWQYSGKGKIKGIEGNVNLNISYIKKDGRQE